MENMMNDELHNYEPTCEEFYPADFNHSEYKEWLDSVHTTHAIREDVKPWAAVFRGTEDQCRKQTEEMMNRAGKQLPLILTKDSSW
jgi:hypothetical protein